MLKLGWIFSLKFKLSEMSFFKLSAPRTIFVDAILLFTSIPDPWHFGTDPDEDPYL
jgi:hypothetical protein